MKIQFNSGSDPMRVVTGSNPNVDVGDPSLIFASNYKPAYVQAFQVYAGADTEFSIYYGPFSGPPLVFACMVADNGALMGFRAYEYQTFNGQFFVRTSSYLMMAKIYPSQAVFRVNYNGVGGTVKIWVLGV